MKNDVATLLKNTLLNVFYPPLCIHCRDVLSKSTLHLCAACMEWMTPLNPFEHCPLCFSDELDVNSQKICTSCQKQMQKLDAVASVFEHEGPAATMVKQLKYSGKTYLAKGLAAYLAYQFLRMEWARPDLIIPMPLSWLRRLDRGYNQSLLLAHELSDLLSIPVSEPLNRLAGGYSQAGLNQEQRQQLTAEAFTLKKGVKLYDKTLLLIDDVMTTGCSLKACAEALYLAYPARIYALTVCRTLE